jgi:hypothetical protein
MKDSGFRNLRIQEMSSVFSLQVDIQLLCDKHTTLVDATQYNGYDVR